MWAIAVSLGGLSAGTGMRSKKSKSRNESSHLSPVRHPKKRAGIASHQVLVARYFWKMAS